MTQNLRPLPLAQQMEGSSIQTRLRAETKISTSPLCKGDPMKVLPHVCPQKDPHCSNMVLNRKHKVKSRQNENPVNQDVRNYTTKTGAYNVKINWGCT